MKSKDFLKDEEIKEEEVTETSEEQVDIKKLKQDVEKAKDVK
jgi:hypothetical protein